MVETKSNFRGEPIHQAPFLEVVERLRSRVVGKMISIEDNIINSFKPVGLAVPWLLLFLWLSVRPAPTYSYIAHR